jgi:hypothetical protein
VDDSPGACDRLADGRVLERTAHFDHVVAARPEVRNDVAADESVGAGDGDPHQDTRKPSGVNRDQRRRLDVRSGLPRRHENTKNK